MVPFFGHGDLFLNVFGHPYFIARSSLRNYLSRLLKDNQLHAVLDIGCGSMPYRDLFPLSYIYHGLEIDHPRNRTNPKVTHFYDGLRFPFDDDSYDCVFCSQVLEHSFEPDTFTEEVLRILKPGGVFILTIPFVWCEHEQPFDSQRFTSFGISHLLNKVGFRSITIQKTNPGICCLIQLFIDFLESIQRKFPRRSHSPTFLENFSGSSNIYLEPYSCHYPLLLLHLWL